MKAIGVIPARWQSTRLPGKMLVDICGKPLIQRVVEQVAKSDLLDHVLVATDDVRIAELVQQLGHKSVMTAADHPSGTDRVAEAVGDEPCDVVVNIQGDEPLIDPGLIDRLIAAMAENAGWQMGTAAAPVRSEDECSSSSVVKVVWNHRHEALYFSRAVIPFVRDGGGADKWAGHWRHVGIYAYRPDFLRVLVASVPCGLEQAERLEQLRALYLGGVIGVIETDEVGMGVDTPEDVATVERLIRESEGQ